MNVALFYLIIILSVSMCGYSAYRVITKKLDIIECLPTWVWFCFMTLPFLYQVKDMGETGNNEQGIGILLTMIVVFLSDNLPVQKMKSSAKKVNNKLYIWMNKIVRSGYFYAICSIILIVYHLIAMGGNIPLLNAILYPELDSIELSGMREAAVKLLDIPFYMKYVLRWNTNIIIPLGVLLLFKNKKYVSGTILFTIGCIYSRIITSKAPLLMLCLAIFGFGIYKLYKKISLKIIVIVIACILVCGLRPTMYFIFNENSPFNCEFTDYEEEPLANKIPYMDIPENTSSEYRLYNNLLRRVVMVPPVVANYWYKYAIVNETYFGYQDMLPMARMGDPEKVVKQSPSNIVGLWAYSTKWPDKVGKTISSNTSMDADAYGRGGMIALIITVLIYFGVRIAMKKLNDQNDYLVNACYVIGIIIIACVLTSAPIQAILIAQGIAPLLLAMHIVRE